MTALIPLDDDGVTPLMRAAQENDSSAIARMAAEGVNLDARDRDGNTALIHAAKNGAEEAALMLMYHKADLRAVNNDGHTALMIAASNGLQPLVERWVVMQAPVDATDKKENSTALMMAIGVNDTWIACRLVEGGADFETLTDKNGNTALTLARRAFPAKDLAFFMHAVNRRHAAAEAAKTARKIHEDEIAHSAGSLTHPVSAPKTAVFRRKTPGQTG